MLIKRPMKNFDQAFGYLVYQDDQDENRNIMQTPKKTTSFLFPSRVYSGPFSATSSAKTSTKKESPTDKTFSITPTKLRRFQSFEDSLQFINIVDTPMSEIPALKLSTIDKALNNITIETLVNEQQVIVDVKDNSDDQVSINDDPIPIETEAVKEAVKEVKQRQQIIQKYQLTYTLIRIKQQYRLMACKTSMRRNKNQKYDDKLQILLLKLDKNEIELVRPTEIDFLQPLNQFHEGLRDRVFKYFYE